MTFWVAGAVVVSGAIGSNAASSAANTQAAAANHASDVQKQIYDQQRQDQMPWMDAGKNALSNLTNLLNSGQLSSKFAPGDLANDPGYQFGMQQGQKALDNSAAARGLGQSGASLKAAERYGQDYAGTKYNDAFNRFYTEQANTRNPLFQLAGLGAGANAQVGQAGQNYANQFGSNVIGGANAQAAATMARGNIYGNVFNQLGAMNWNKSPDYSGLSLP